MARTVDASVVPVRRRLSPEPQDRRPDPRCWVPYYATIDRLSTRTSAHGLHVLESAMVCAMQYWHPAARLATWAMRRLNPRSTSLSRAQTAAAICANALTIFGLRCMIRMLLGLSIASMLIVGTILNVINQGDALWPGAAVHWWKLVLTYCVPFCVATFGAYSAYRAAETV